MAISKRDYEAIAKCIAKNYGKTIGGKDSTLVADLSEVFKADNPRFNWREFVTAALIDGEEQYHNRDTK